VISVFLTLFSDVISAFTTSLTKLSVHFNLDINVSLHVGHILSCGGNGPSVSIFVYSMYTNYIYHIILNDYSILSKLHLESYHPGQDMAKRYIRV
jgi:hypothetical protein